MGNTKMVWLEYSKNNDLFFNVVNKLLKYFLSLILRENLWNRMKPVEN